MCVCARARVCACVCVCARVCVCVCRIVSPNNTGSYINIGMIIIITMIMFVPKDLQDILRTVEKPNVR